MKKIVFLSVVASLALGSIALAEGRGEDGGRSHHGLFARVDENGDGKVTRAEANVEIKRFFERADQNHDGKVTKDELAALRDQKLDKLRDHMSEKLWSKDANKDGKLERSEISKMPERFFAKIDTNSDGVLTKEELAAAGNAMESRFEGRAAERFSKLDTNSDGAVDLTEFTAKTNAMFDKFDANKDGVVEKSEVPSRGHGWKHGRGGDCHGERGDKPAKTAAAPKAG
jgi:Ca2+-binding EF-hand superfamily protein